MTVILVINKKARVVYNANTLGKLIIILVTVVTVISVIIRKVRLDD